MLSEIIEAWRNSETWSVKDPGGPRRSARELRVAYDALRQQLANNFAPGDRVALDLPYGTHYLLAIIACLERGIVFVPLRATWPAARKAWVARLAGARAVLTAADVATAVAGPTVKVDQPPPPAPEATAYVIFTSGTSGEPKGVAVSRRSLASFVAALQGWEPGSAAFARQLLVTDFTFDISLIDVFTFLARRTELTFSAFGGDAFRLAAEIETERPTFMNAVPTTFGLLTHGEVVGRADLASLALLFVGGARFPLSLYRDLKAGHLGRPAVYNLYGPTETTVYSHAWKLTWDEQRDLRDGQVTVGAPLSGVRCLTVGEDGAPRPPGVAGEVLLGGEQLMQGYVNPGLSAEEPWVWLDGQPYYATGDLGSIDVQGRLFIVGRKTETLKRRGYRLNLNDIDAHIQRLPGVIGCASVAAPDPAAEHRVVAFVQLRPPATEAVVRAGMTVAMLPHEIPDEIRLVTGYPLNNSGKIDKQALLAALLAEAVPLPRAS